MAAQKYTHRASRYFLVASAASSPARASVICRQQAVSLRLARNFIDVLYDHQNITL